ncbi:MAG: hypothetical protein WA958_05935 [Tunicatimonas sp.]
MKNNLAILFLLLSISVGFAQNQSEPFKKANTIIIETGEPESVAIGHVVRELRNQGYTMVENDGNYIHAVRKHDAVFPIRVIDLALHFTINGGTISMKGYVTDQNAAPYLIANRFSMKQSFKMLQEFANKIAAPNQQYFAIK